LIGDSKLQAENGRVKFIKVNSRENEVSSRRKRMERLKDNAVGRAAAIIQTEFFQKSKNVLRAKRRVLIGKKKDSALSKAFL
jgi:hypothetical protein